MVGAADGGSGNEFPVRECLYFIICEERAGAEYLIFGPKMSLVSFGSRGVLL